MKSLSFSKCILLLICLTQGVRAIAQTPDANGIVYVKPAATGTGDGSSWTNATASLRQAIHAAGVSKVFVAIGTYKVGAQSFVMKNNVEIYGGFNPAAGIDDLSDTRILPRSPNFTGGSVLDGERTRTVVWNVCTEEEPMDNTAVLDGFVLTNGLEPKGGGMYNFYASPTLRNLLFKMNSADVQNFQYPESGGAMLNRFSAPIISHSIFMENFGFLGSAIKNESPISDPVVLNNVLIVRNIGGPDYIRPGRAQGTIDSETDIILNNVTIADNNGMFALVQVAGTATIRNSIILGSVLELGGVYNAHYSLIQSDRNTDDGNIDGTPYSSISLFNDVVGMDYTHRLCSPAVNAGSNALYPDAGTDGTDLAGKPRLVNGTIDLGAFETDKPKCGPDANGVIYVKTASSGNGTGDSWDNATDNLRTAIHLNGVQQVWVEKGTFPLFVQFQQLPWDTYMLSISGSLSLKNNVAIFGGFDPSNGITNLTHNRIMPNAFSPQGTIIDGVKKIRCVNNVHDVNTPLDSTALMDGFTLVNGHTYEGMIFTGNGGGIQNVFASPTLRNLLINKCTATFSGGGIFNQNSSPIMTNIVLKDNVAHMDGGGIINDKLSAPVMSNVTISGNKANYAAGLFNRNSSPTLNNVSVNSNIAVFDGGGIYNDAQSAPSMTNVNVVANSAAYGAGVFNRNSSPLMTDMIVSGNIAVSHGGGIYNDALSAPVMTNVKITANQAEAGAGLVNRNSSPVLKNADITGNIASAEGAAMLSSQSSAPKLINVTMVGNTPDAFTSDNAVVSLANSIMFGATSGTAYESEYSLIEDNTSTADGNVDATGIEWTDVFTDPENEDYTLKTGSAAANKGNNTLYTGLDENTKDLAGNERVHSFSNGGVIDLGAYEGTSEVVISPDVNGIVYVKTLTAGNGSGTNWENPTNSVQKAIDAVGTQKVFVATGNYNVPSPNSFVMKNNVAVYGGFDPDNGIDDLADPRILPNHGAAQGSVLNGKSERPVIWNINNGLTNTAVLDGFTITQGLGDMTSGGGIMNDHVSPTLRNLVISGNSTTFGGGGICNYYSSPVISNSIIKGNIAGFGGGGIFNDYSSSVIADVIIKGNTAPNGAGVWFGGDTENATLTNVTIAGNLTGNGATIVSGGVSLKSSIVYGGISGTYSAQYSLIEGSTATTNGNMNATGITLTNLFADHANGDFTLAACSPVTNAGVPDALNLPVYDLAGNSRIFAGRVDMGAYENTNSAGNPGIASIPGITSMIQTANGTTGYYNSCNEMLALVITTGATGSIEGMTTAKVWIDDTQQKQYVRRHYEITPEQNAATASGKITLYFTQADFDAFNTLNPTAQLPDGPSGSAANLLIEKRGGASTDGTGLPSTYPGTTETISNVEVVWNSTTERWEVSFSTTGFSGFFVKTTSAPLPVRWISFTAHLNDDKHGVLDWKVDQTNVADYQIERSSNARDFRTIGRIAGSSNGISQYHFIDPIAVGGTFYYRIRQTDLDGTFAYSRIVSLSGGEAALLTGYPNPTRAKVTVQLGAEYIGTRLRLVNIAGIQLQQLTVREETFEVNLGAYPAGVYILYTFDGKILRLIRN